MTDNENAAWRDEERLSLEELDAAVARSAEDSQVDDVTGSDAGEEQAFGHGHEAADTGPAGGAERTDPHRSARPSTTGRTGPN